MPAAVPVLPGRLLSEVSRSFSLTLRVLPTAVRFQIGLAYLLARTSDTIADTGHATCAQRLSALHQFRDAVASGGSQRVDFTLLASSQTSPAEQALLLRANESLGLLRAVSSEDLQLMRRVLNTIVCGQMDDVRRFDLQGGLRALSTAAELDAYTHAVAGCVGEFWTELTLLHCMSRRDCPEGFIEQGIRFGKGLQLVNVLRDIPADLRNGRCYLPQDELERAGLNPEALRDPAHWPRVRPVFDAWRAKADDHLRMGSQYVLAIPFGQYRLRLACALPLLMGWATLDLLRNANPLQPEPRLKISRARVRRILADTTWRLPFRTAWGKLFTRP